MPVATSLDHKVMARVLFVYECHMARTDSAICSNQWFIRRSDETNYKYTWFKHDHLQH